jgi:hypothetical protein
MAFSQIALNLMHGDIFCRRHALFISVSFLFLQVCFPHLPSSFAADRGIIAVDGKSPADFVAGRTGKGWAVVIGIDEYRHVPRLTYASTDAKSMATLLSQQGFEVVSLYDSSATRQAILHELGDEQYGAYSVTCSSIACQTSAFSH